MNSWIAKLGPTHITLLESIVAIARAELRDWFEMIADPEAIANREKITGGDGWWLETQFILNMFLVISQELDRAFDPVSSDDLPDDWSQVFDEVPAELVFAVPSGCLDRFAELRWSQLSGNDLVEKKRALDDVHEAVEELFGRAFPTLLGQNSVTVCEDSALFECSKEVTHVISHFEGDFLNE